MNNQAESFRYSKALARERNKREGDLVKKLELTLRTGIVSYLIAVKLALEQQFYAKH